MKYKMLRDYDVLKKGQIVFQYTGATYGCCDRNEIAVTAEQDKTPFIGVPAEWLETSETPRTDALKKEVKG